MTKVQLEVLKCIEKYIYEHKGTPTLAELSKLLNKSTTAIYKTVKILHREGYIVKTETGFIKRTAKSNKEL